MRFQTICFECVHLSPDEGEEDTMPACAAFPQGIPDEIIRLGFDHRLEFPGDNGIRFEPRPGADMNRVETVVARE